MNMDTLPKPLTGGMVDDHFGANDVFLNMAGGIRVDDPAIDLAVLAALLSTLETSRSNPPSALPTK